MNVYPEPTLDMLTLDQAEDDHEACNGFGVSGGFVRISLTTSWDVGTKCDICGQEIEINTVWMEHIEGGCIREPCPHADAKGDCTLLRHDKVHFRHLSRNFDCLPDEARHRALAHWGLESI